MPRGGARVNSGPAPDPNALRRDRPSDQDGWTLLPAGGRKGDVPSWPLAAFGGGLADLIADREAVIWAEIWRTPQAAAWERLGWTHDVALYVRMLAVGEAGSEKALSEARQWSDRLGLNPAAMLRNRWRIAADEVTPLRAAKAAGGRPSARDRLKAFSDGGA